MPTPPQKKHAWPRVLLIALLPLVVSGTVFLCQWQAFFIYALTTTEDGSRIAAAMEGVHGYRRKRTRIVTWDEELQNQRMVCTTDGYVTALTLSRDGKLLVGTCYIITQGQTPFYSLRIWDAERGTELYRYGLQADSAIGVKLTMDEEAALVVGQNKCQLLRISDGEVLVSQYVRADVGYESVSPTIVTMRSAVATGGSNLEIYELHSHDLRRLWTHKSIWSRVIGEVDDGNLLIYGANGCAIYDRHGTKVHDVTVKFQAPFAIHDGRVYEWGPTGKINEHELATGKLVRSTPIPAAASALYGPRLQGNNRVLSQSYEPHVGGSIGQTRLETSQTVIRQLQFFNGRSIWWLIAVVCGCAGFCCGLLVLDGRQSRWRYRPIVDLLAVNMFAGSCLLLRITLQEANVYVQSLEIAFLLGSLAGYVFLACVWVMLGAKRAFAKLPWVIGILASGWGLLIAIGSYANRLQLDAVIVAVSLMTSGCIGLTVVRILAGRLQRDQVPAPDDAESQISLREILSITIAFACLAAVGRLSSLYQVTPIAVLLFISHGIALSLVGLASVWMAMGNQWFLLRLVVLVVAVIAAGYASQLAEHLLELQVPEWYVCVAAATAVVVSGSLMVLRAHGFAITPPMPTTRTP